MGLAGRWERGFRNLGLIRGACRVFATALMVSLCAWAQVIEAPPAKLPTEITLDVFSE